jgi:hypothetical protein
MAEATILLIAALSGVLASVLDLVSVVIAARSRRATRERRGV